MVVRLLLFVAVIACPPPDDEDSAYLIEVQGLDGGDYFYAGETIEGVRVYVKKFVILNEYDEKTTKRTIKSSALVADGELDVKVACRDENLLDKTFNINSDGSEIPPIEIKEGTDSQNCTLTVNYSSGEDDERTSVAFSITNPDGEGRPCVDDTDSYIVGRGHRICFNKTVELNDKCQGVQLMSYRYDHSSFRQLVSGAPNNPNHNDYNSYIVIIADNVPSGCQLTVDDKGYQIKMPSSLPNLTSKITKVGYDNDKELAIVSEQGTALFVSNGSKGYYRYKDNKSIYPALTDEIRLMVFDDKDKDEIKWSYLAGPRLLDADGGIMLPKIGVPFTVDSKHLVKKVAGCEIISYNKSASNKSIVSFNNQKLSAGHLLAVVEGNSCQKIQVGKFEVPFAQPRVNIATRTRGADAADGIAVTAQLLTKTAFSRSARVNAENVADKVFVYKKAFDQDWQLISEDSGSDWDTTIRYNIGRPDNLEEDHSCRGNSISNECKSFLMNNHILLVRVTVDNEDYWY